MMNAKYHTRGALLVGPVIEARKVITGEQLGVCPENRERLLSLARKYRLRRHEDGWFVDGKGHRSHPPRQQPEKQPEIINNSLIFATFSVKPFDTFDVIRNDL